MKALPFFMLLFFLAGCDQTSAPPARTLDLSAHAGEWVLVNYWAPWCKPCIEEIPELNSVHLEHPGISVYGVNFDGSTGDALLEQEATLGVAFPTLTDDPHALLGIPRPAVLPTTLVVNPQGELVETLLGPQTERSLLEATGSAFDSEFDGQN